ncbi:MAG: hypothetical protein H6728_15470 [Myxococcales bacterium]|nr:hypothetical protein [Myxococcales bacterium]MCB9644471.1 hypothetical protein [Myxococcales bacterium]
MLISMRSFTLFGLVFALCWFNQCQCNNEGTCQDDAQCTAPTRCIEQRCQTPTQEQATEPPSDAASEDIASEQTNESNETPQETLPESSPEIAEASPEQTQEPTNEPSTEPSAETKAEAIPETNPEPPAERPAPVCTNGTQRPCYTGPIQTQHVGACRDGIETCEDGQWSACTNERQPQPEKCDGQDNDCDGRTDEQIPQEGQLCNTSLPGVCASGKLSCENGALDCLPYKQATEICDKLDNDCDGKVDEGC